MKNRFCMAAATLALSLFTMNAQATIVTNLYEVELPAQTQTESEWQQLCQQGLRQVLERTVGANNMHHPDIQKAIQNAKEYVEQFHYEDQSLVIKFSAELIQNIAHKAGDTVWGQRRPNVVLWLAIEENNERRLVGVETDPQLQLYLNQVAKQKGIPLVLPLMDIEDMAAVNVNDVWGRFASVQSHANTRYNAQTMLIARVTHPEANRWEAQWQLHMGNQAPTWNSTAGSLEDLLAQGLSTTVDNLKTPEPRERALNQNDVGKPYLIAIANIDSSSHFNQVARYLRSLDGVIDVNIRQIIGQSAVFEITPQGRQGRAAFEKALMLDGRLAAVPQSDYPADVARVYRWGVGPEPAFEFEPVTVQDEQDPLTSDAEPDEEAD